MSDSERKQKIEALKKEIKKEMMLDFKQKDLENRANMSSLKIFFWGVGLFFGILAFLVVMAVTTTTQEDLMYMYAKKLGATERIKQTIDCSKTVGKIAVNEYGRLKCSGPPI